MKITAISVLGTQKDAHGGDSEARWNTWRPTIGLVQQPELPIDELHLLAEAEFETLAKRVKADVETVSPRTRVFIDFIELDNPWDFEEVYGKFLDYSRLPCFHEENTDYYIHISTGSHVEQICLFLLAEARHLPGKLVQTSPREGHVRHSSDSRGTAVVIDLDLSKYDKLAARFETERRSGLSFLKQGIDTRNAAFNKLIETIERVALLSSDPILLTGPTGAGKSQLARQIHELRKHNGRLAGPFVDVNCATIGGELARSALFGHKKGAFTGALADQSGYLREANGGTLFLDEIGELPLEAQAMLLKAIEEKTFRPIGAAKDEHSDFQLICGTNRDLSDAVEKGAFRADLLARINLWSFPLPGLAERREDIEPNIDWELARRSRETGRHFAFNKEARERFLAFALAPSTRWQGNFRDLNAMMVRMTTLAEGGRITAQNVADEIERSRNSAQGPKKNTAQLAEILGEGFEERFDPFDLVQFEYVVSVCKTCANMAEASKKLFAVSRLEKKSTNDTDRLSKYLARFGVKFKQLQIRDGK